MPVWAQTTLGVLVSLGLLVWAGWNVDFGEAWKAVTRMNVGLYASW